MRDRVAQELCNRIVANKFKEITITMKCNGDKVTIIPCGYEITSFPDIEYFLVECRLPWAGHRTIEEVAQFLLNYETEIEENEKEKKALKKYYEEHKNEDRSSWFDFYSDWHKDVYGYRPR